MVTYNEQRVALLTLLDRVTKLFSKLDQFTAVERRQLVWDLTEVAERLVNMSIEASTSLEK